jgi:hypothetical protein
MRFTEDRNKNITVRKSNAKLVDINRFRGFGVFEVGESVERVVASVAEVSEILRIDVLWISGNVNWEKGCG